MLKWSWIGFQGNKWWQESDEPWQTLACCKEIAAAVRSEDPTQFVSRFPVHQVNLPFHRMIQTWIGFDKKVSFTMIFGHSCDEHAIYRYDSSKDID